MQRTRWFFHVANKLSKVHKHALICMKKLHTYTPASFRKNTRNLKVKVRQGVEDLTLHFTFSSIQACLIPKPHSRLFWTHWREGLSSFSTPRIPSSLCHNCQLPGLCRRLSLTDPGSLVVPASVLDGLPRVTWTPAQLHLICAPGYSCSSHGLTWPLGLQVPPTRYAVPTPLGPCRLCQV